MRSVLQLNTGQASLYLMSEKTVSSELVLCAESPDPELALKRLEAQLMKLDTQSYNSALTSILMACIQELGLLIKEELVARAEQAKSVVANHAG